METNSDLQRVYGKTEAGRQVLSAGRRTSMPVKARAALIMINGKDDLRTLTPSIGPDAAAVIDELLRAGLIELLSPAPAAARPAPHTSAPSGAVKSPADARLFALQRQAVASLRPYFGPDVVSIAQSLVSATTVQAFILGLDAIEQQLAVYVGRKQAARLLAPLRAG